VHGPLSHNVSRSISVKNAIMEKEIIDMEGNIKRCGFTVSCPNASNMKNNRGVPSKIIFLSDLCVDFSMSKVKHEVHSIFNI
jgi:hypothetical protein